MRSFISIQKSQMMLGIEYLPLLFILNINIMDFCFLQISDERWTSLYKLNFYYDTWFANLGGKFKNLVESQSLSYFHFVNLQSKLCEK